MKSLKAAREVNRRDRASNEQIKYDSSVQDTIEDVSNRDDDAEKITWRKRGQKNGQNELKHKTCKALGILRDYQRDSVKAERSS